jgi:hypothetical protein
MRATISLLRNGFEEEAVTFGYPRERVFRQDGQSPLWVHRVSLAMSKSLPFFPR